MSEPLPREVFDAQLFAILAHHGGEALTARSGRPAALAVFAAEAALEPVTASDPRHRYGLCYSAEASAGSLEDWITSGEAYKEYLSMNVCRFGCG